MKFSYNWLKTLSGFRGNAYYLANILKLHAFDVKSVERLKKDFLLDIDVLPNRSIDCFSHIGVAREIAAISNKSFNPAIEKIKIIPTAKMCSSLKVSTKNPELCSRYFACVVENVKIKESPKWLKERLALFSMKSINNIVDATNYAMLLSGQPFHAFDYEKISKNCTENVNEILVRTAKKGEKAITIHNEEVVLDESMLVIADCNEPLAIAGIKGCKKAEIDNSTRVIIIEAAIFDPASIRTSSKKLGIKTESSLRFESGISDWTLEFGLNTLLGLINRVSGGLLRNKYDVDYRKHYQRKVSFSLEFLNDFIGNEFEEHEVLQILARLDIGVKKIKVKNLLLEKSLKLLGRPYKYGASTHLDAPDVFDCSSFVRYLFYEAGIEIPRPSIDQFDFSRKISMSEMEPGDLVFSRGSRPHTSSKHPDGIGHVGIYLGKNRVVHASGSKKRVVKENISAFTKNNWRGAGRIDDLSNNNYLAFIPNFRQDITTKEELAEEIIRIKGFNNLESKKLYGSLVVPKANDRLLLEEKAGNLLYSCGLSEVCNYSFIGDGDKKNFGMAAESLVKIKNPTSREVEYMRPNLIVNLIKNIKSNARFYDEFGIYETGNIYESANLKPFEKKSVGFVIFRSKKETKKGDLFYNAKGIADYLLEGTSILGFKYKEDINTYGGYWNKDEFVKIISKDMVLGQMGYLSRDILQKYSIEGQVVACLIDLACLAKTAQDELEYSPLLKFPSVSRDISILVKGMTKVVDIENIIENFGGQYLSRVELFDIYENNDSSDGVDDTYKKSMAFHLTFQSDIKTLTDKEVNSLLEKIITAVEERGWEVRR